MDVAEFDGVAVVGHDAAVVGAETTNGWVCMVMSGNGLRPPVASSVDPSGIPTRPTVDRESMPGDAGDAVGLDAPAAVAHVPEADPATPAPSNSGVGADVPDVAAVVGDIPLTAVLAPDEHVVEAVIAPNGVGPAAVGLTPGVASSVAPSGIPVAPTAAAGPIPSGEVIPREGVVVAPTPTCAETAPSSKSDQATAAINMAFIGSILLSFALEQLRSEPVRRRHELRPDRICDALFEDSIDLGHCRTIDFPPHDLADRR